MPRNDNSLFGRGYCDYVIMACRDTDDYTIATRIMEGLIVLLKRRRQHLDDNNLEEVFGTTCITVNGHERTGPLESPLGCDTMAIKLTCNTRRRG